jgi:endonuclease/exonuclease/phosphatase (EEP) superfamily protein YafD
VLLQEVDAGRLVSFGVDQSLWLARRLGMDRRFFPTIEGLRGLAVLSRAPIVFDDGVLLESLDQQTGMQRVQVLPSDRPITFYNTQLGLLLAGDSLEEQERNQRQQLNQILATIDTHIEVDYGGRVENVLMLLAGTFHNVPDSPLLQTLERTGFSDPFAGYNPNLTSTLVRQDRTGRIDYLWIWRQGLRWTGNGVIDNPASDHRLAFVNLQFGR